MGAQALPFIAPPSSRHPCSHGSQVDHEGHEGHEGTCHEVRRQGHEVWRQGHDQGALAEAVATSTGLKKADCTKVINSLAEIVGKEVKKTGKVILPGIAMIKTRVRPATK